MCGIVTHGPGGGITLLATDSRCQLALLGRLRRSSPARTSPERWVQKLSSSGRQNGIAQQCPYSRLTLERGRRNPSPRTRTASWLQPCRRFTYPYAHQSAPHPVRRIDMHTDIHDVAGTPPYTMSGRGCVARWHAGTTLTPFTGWQCAGGTRPQMGPTPNYRSYLLNLEAISQPVEYPGARR